MTTLISFYTKDWKYPKYAEKLKYDCARISLDCVIEELPTTGSYLKNTCMKPQYILDKLILLKSPVLWVDVDASILQYPEILSGLENDGIDFAARKMPDSRLRTWHVGTMWFNYKPNVIEFLEKWIANTGNLSDESALEYTWKNQGGELKTFNIPAEYFYINKSNNLMPSNTVIMHRISNSTMKKSEMTSAAEKRKRGEW